MINFVICGKPQIYFILQQILELQMNDFKYHYLFTSFDLETFEMEDFRYNFVNGKLPC